jgi:tRNA(Ile)-lysidine synthase
MKITIKPGKYIVAVSGGVDSVVLLNLLIKQKDVELVVAHLDHGIRTDSVKDRRFVAELAQKYGLRFVYKRVNLGQKASEELARQARYDFLNSVKNKYSADAIVTAHHQDDVLETVIINLLRGTGRKGLSSLKSSSEIIRPLLNTPKNDILEYAKSNSLKWREDETNRDTKYLRNWVRHLVLPKLDNSKRKHLINIQKKAFLTNTELENLLDDFIQKNKSLNRRLIILLPQMLAKELVAHWLRKNGIADFDSKLVEKIVIDARTYASGKKTAIKKGVFALYSKSEININKQ